MNQNQSKALLEIIKAGIDEVKPQIIFPRLFNSLPYPELAEWLNADNKYLLCTGKAAISSAEVILSLQSCDDHFVLAPSQSVTSQFPQLKIAYGSHPIPDLMSFEATQKLVPWLSSIPENAALLVVLSGGTSALLVSPVPGLPLEAKMTVNEMLIRSGASIQEINTVRKHLSAVKGGWLAKVASKCRSLVLVISDVIGDDLAVIGSGPFYADPTTFREAKDILERYGLWQQVPREVQMILTEGIAGKIPETPKPGTTGIPHHIVASNSIARQAAAEKARLLGYNPVTFSEAVSGNINDAAQRIAISAKEKYSGSALIWGGEVTIRVSGSGIGGRNQHLSLLLTELFAGNLITFGAAGTDGIDGNSEAAGAWTNGETLAKARKHHLDLQQYKANFDSFHFFEQLGQTIVTGPTGTNVMDLYIALT